MGKAEEEARDQETQRDCNLGPPSTRPFPPTSQKMGTPWSRKEADTLNTELCPHVITDLCLHAYLVLLPHPNPHRVQTWLLPDRLTSSRLRSQEEGREEFFIRTTFWIFNNLIEIKATDHQCLVKLLSGGESVRLELMPLGAHIKGSWSQLQVRI